ncbi:MAG: hypothetical protein CMH54_08340 [Myxococcales bacterium]|nr:hypothetical protein [Myxococcales bacterium]|tara:strand:- start:323 stop:829 length:507 start_codon:yes stop_codon:yes gene_type:complete
MKTSYVLAILMFAMSAFVFGCDVDETAELENEVLGYCADNPVDAVGSFCASIKLPEDMVGTPEQVSFHFFDSIPPMGPPSLMGINLTSPEDLQDFVAGAEVPMVLENLPESGAYYLYIAVYMPGGGAASWVLVPGIDYVGGQSGDEAMLEFTGEAMNLDQPFELRLAE